MSVKKKLNNIMQNEIMTGCFNRFDLAIRVMDSDAVKGRPQKYKPLLSGVYGPKISACASIRNKIRHTRRLLIKMPGARTFRMQLSLGGHA
jgi:hypothetical protein